MEKEEFICVKARSRKKSRVYGAREVQRVSEKSKLGPTWDRYRSADALNGSIEETLKSKRRRDGIEVCTCVDRGVRVYISGILKAPSALR